AARLQEIELFCSRRTQLCRVFFHNMASVFEGEHQLWLGNSGHGEMIQQESDCRIAAYSEPPCHPKRSRMLRSRIEGSLLLRCLRPPPRKTEIPRVARNDKRLYSRNQTIKNRQLHSECLPQLAGIDGAVDSGIQVNHAGADQFLDLGIEVLHPFGTSGLDAGEQSVAFVFSGLYAVASLLVGLEDLD